MRVPKILALALITVLTITGCAANLTTSASTPAAPTTASATPTALTTPSPNHSNAPREIVVSTDTLNLVDNAGNALTTVPFTDGDAVLALLSEQLGSTPQGTRDPADAKYQFEQTYYDWNGVRLIVADDRRRSTMSFTVDELNGVRLSAIGGIGVGSTRESALTKGAESTGFDGDGDGLADYLRVAAVTALNTKSLTTPGAVGSNFVLIAMEGDLVTAIQTGGNDYSDL